MSKYIIDLRPDCKVVQQICASDENVNVGARSVGLLDALTDDYVKENFKYLQDTAYQKGINDGSLDVKQRVEGAYQRGLDDAWEAARKIAEMWETIDNDELLEIFGLTAKIGESTIGTLFKKQTASEAIAKLKAYEEKQKEDEDVKRGDVVRHKINGLTYIVTLANECGYVLLDSDGNFATSCITNSFEKTGKHVDIDKILEGLRYDN